MFFRNLIRFSGGFFGKLEAMVAEYKRTLDLDALRIKADALICDNREEIRAGSVIISTGEDLIDDDYYDAGIVLLKVAYDNGCLDGNITVMLVRLAENEFKNGNVDAGKKYILELCDYIDNYEETIGFNGLTDVWEKYKHYVTADIENLERMRNPEPLSPEECSESIEDIFTLCDGELLCELSIHLRELSASGNRIDLLTPQETNVYYVDEFIENINSDGLDHYLFYYGTNFESLRSALAEIGCKAAIELTDRVIKRLPRKRIPQNLDKWQDVLISLEVKDIDFEDLEDFYFETVESQILRALSDYVKANREHFR